MSHALLGSIVDEQPALSLLHSLTCRAKRQKSCHLGHAFLPLQQHSIDAWSMYSAHNWAVLQAFAQSADAEDFEMRCLSWHLLAQLMQCHDAVEPGIAVHFSRQDTAQPVHRCRLSTQPGSWVAQSRLSHAPKCHMHACAAPQHCCRLLHSPLMLGTPGKSQIPHPVVP